MKRTTKALSLMLILVVAVVTLTGCSMTKEGMTNDLEGLAVYTASEDMTGYTKCEEMEGIEFYYPSNYVSVGKDAQPMYMDPEIAGASVNLVSDNFPSAFTFEGYIDASIIGIKNQMTVKGDISKEYINLNGVKAGKIEYVATTDDENYMKLTQVIIVKESKAYILTVGALENDYEALKPKLEQMVKSFK